MSNLIVCRECDAPNTPGSKFCNNCGARLPLGTNLICSNCGTSNPRNRVFCDNCGTRLVKEETPKAPARPEDPPPGGTKAFTLPARPPGETGELDPNTLPDWLRTGDTTSADTDDVQGQHSDELPDWLKASLIAKGADPDNLPSLEELTPEKRTTDDLPDWLVSASDTSPIIESPKEISTEVYLDLVSRAQEAPDRDDPFDADEANLPDWLAEAAAFPDLAPAAGEEPNQSVVDDTDASDSPARPPLPDATAPAAESEEGGLSGLTDWLADADALPESAAAEADSGSGLTDWLTDPDAFAESDQADSDSQFGLTDPHLFADTGTTGDEATEEAELADWLADLDRLDDHNEFVVGDAGSAEEDAEADWFDDFEPPDTDSLAQPPDTASRQTDEQADFAEPLPHWLADIAAEGDTLVGPEQADQASDDLFAAAPEAADFTDEAALEPDEPAPPQDPDWLAELVAFEETSPTAAEKAQAEQPPDVIAAEQRLEAETGAHSELEPADDDEWLAMDSPADDDPLLQPPIAEELPEWLEQLGPPLSSRSPDSDQEEAHGQAPLPSEDLPDWIASLRPNSSMLGSSLPSALSPDSSLPEPLAEIPDELAGAELPEWLQDIPITSSPPGPAMPPVEELSAIPDWLITDRDLADRRDADDSLVAQSPAGQEWGNILDELPSALPLEQSLARADIPDWLQALRPRELHEEDPAESEQAIPTSGPLAGMPGIIAVESLILKPRTATTFDHITPTVPPTAEQQQQVALLRQLARSEPGTTTLAIPKNGRLSGPGVSPATTSLWLRLLLAGILLAAILLGLLAPDLLPATGASPGRDSSGTAPTGNVEPVYTFIQAAAGRPVLVAFEYTPALAGELTPQANLLLAQLEANGSPVLTLSQYPAGTALAAASQNLLRHDLGYLPGDALGLRQLGNCLSQELTCQTVPGWIQRADSQQLLSDVVLIILLTGEGNSLINWIEQVGVVSDIPIVAGVTQALAPVAAPYLATGQLQGVLEGAPATAVYQQSFLSDLANSRDDSRIAPTSPNGLTAQRLAQLVVAAFLFIGALLYGISGSIAKEPTLSQSKGSARHTRP